MRRFTGRKTNPLYDVKLVTLELVVDSRRIPEISEALSRQNFITIVDLQMSPVDAYQDIKEGFVYGQAPVSLLTVTLETVWLREWTSQFMPNEVKQALGIPAQQPPANG
jgi:hypothetical protein